MADPLIKLENITKVFLTDEIETHALSGIYLEIEKGNMSRSPAHPAAESPPCSQSLACSIPLPRAPTC